MPGIPLPLTTAQQPEEHKENNVVSEILEYVADPNKCSVRCLSLEGGADHLDQIFSLY